MESLRIEDEILRQKSRIQWLEVGNRNTAYLPNSIKNHRNRKRIVSLTQPNRSQTSNEKKMKEEAV